MIYNELEPMERLFEPDVQSAPDLASQWSWLTVEYKPTEHLEETLKEALEAQECTKP